MKTKFSGILTLLLAFVVQISFAQEKTITGTVSDETGPLPGVSIIVKGTSVGTETDFDGKYTIKAKQGDILRFSFVGMKTKEITVKSSNNIAVTLEGDNILEEVVVTALGIKQKTNTLTYSAQPIKSEILNITQDNNLKTALSGKVAGAQVASQAGSKLGQSGQVFLRGAISAKGREEAIYVVDGVVTNADNVDLENVESINVLKGPNANALYGLRAAGGVIVITTKSGKNGKVKININSTLTFDNIAYTPDYQNEYGQGYAGEGEWRTWNQPGFAPDYFAPLNGFEYINASYADESWGPKFDGREYAPWYAWFPGTDDNPNPYYGKTQKWEAQPNNIKDYFNTALTLKNTVDISGGNDMFRGRIGFTDLRNSGILPNSGLNRKMVSTKFNVDLSEKFSIGVNAIYTKIDINGDFNDGYSNKTTGSFNSWFGRQIDVNRMRELKDLKNPNGYHVSWNWWNPRLYSFGNAGAWRGLDATKPTFWYNPYWQTEVESYQRLTERIVASANARYQITKKLGFNLVASRNAFTFDYERKAPYAVQESNNANSFGYTNYVNSFSIAKQTFSEVTINPSLDYSTSIGEDFQFDATFGYIDRTNSSKQLTAYMSSTGNPDGGEARGLVIPDLYNFSNSRQVITPGVSNFHFKTRSLYSRLQLDYKDFLNFNFDIRNDWDSRYDIANQENSNSFLFGSAGLNFIFSKVLSDSNVLSFGKAWINYARVGTEAGTYQLNPAYGLGAKYNGIPTQFTPGSVAATTVAPATSGSLEVGTDLRFFNDRLSLNLVYYNENREGEILNSAIPSASGNTGLIDNGGSVNRTGIEAVLGATPIKTDDFKWDVTLNFAKNTTKVKELAAGTESYLLGESTFQHARLLNRIGEEWGQLEGNRIKRNENGTPVINDSGLYESESTSFGSVLPDFNGGFINTLSYKGLTLGANIAFQSGGKFFSLSELWGNYSGLLNETAGLNDKGNPKRDAVADGGGVHVVGVDKNGGAVDNYIDAETYYKQFRRNDIAEPFVHDASYIKLSELSLSYSLPKKFIKGYFDNISVGVIARNVALLSVASDNIHSWDPSELSRAWGENGQLPGTRSYGFNVRIGF